MNIGIVKSSLFGCCFYSVFWQFRDCVDVPIDEHCFGF